MEVLISILISILALAALGLCIYKIVTSIFLEAKYKAVLSQNISYSSVKGEPFQGSLFLSALLVYIYQNAYDAEHEMRFTFKSIFKADYGPYCRAAESLHTSLNGDLLVESLAAVLSKSSYDKDLLSLIFSSLTQAEFVWNEKDRGTKPSLYLARLLDYSFEDDELLKAYKTLGLSRGATLAQVKSAHRKLAARFHPDRFAIKKTSTSAATEIEAFMKIQNAYELIIKNNNANK